MTERIPHPRLIACNAETEWTRQWETTLRRVRWVEKAGKFYPKGVAPDRMNGRDDDPLTPRPPRLEHAAIWRPRKALSGCS